MWRWDNLYFFAWVFVLCTSWSWHIFHSSKVRFFCEWLRISEIHLPPDDHILHLVFHMTQSQWISLSQSLSLPLSLSVSVSLILFPSLPVTLSGYLPFHRGPCVTPFIVLFGWLWRTMAVWSLGRHSACVNLHLSIGSSVLRCQERLCDLCVTEGGFHRWKSELQEEGFILCECMRAWVCVCMQPVEFDRTKQVKTTHCVCFNVSSWLAPQGCHSQETMHLEAAGCTHNQCFTHLNWAAVEGCCCHDK